MGSWIECKDDKGHNVEQNKYNFLKAFADNKPLVCKCGGKLIYQSHQVYPNSNNYKAEFVLVNVKRIKEPYPKYVPFLLNFRDQNGDYAYWLQYWVRVKGHWRYGQYSPLLNTKQMRSLSKLL